MLDVGWISAIATSVAALAASIAAVASVWTIFIYHKQMKISQEQVKVSQEQIYDLHRPVLMIGALDQNYNATIENVGSGVALNIQGTYFQARSRYSEDSFMLETLGTSLAVGQQRKTQLGSKPILDGDSEVGEHPKYTLIPKEPTEASWRITLTYHDIFDRKYASIFDGYVYGAETKNKCIALLLNIPQDIEDLEDEVIPDNQVVFANDDQVLPHIDIFP